MKTKLFRAGDRGVKDIGWLQSNFTFSFSDFREPDKAGFGLLRVFNDDFVEAGKGFGLHAHNNMEIISIMLSGKMNHKDSMGYSDVVEKDWVQIMSAGSGLRHEEYNVGDDQVNFLQIWIEPKLQNISPRYQKRFFPEASRKNQLKTVISSDEGTEHCWINQNAKLSLGHFDGGSSLNYQFNSFNKCTFLFLMEGELEVAGERLLGRDGIGIWNSDAFSISVKAESRFAIIEAPVNH